MINEKICLITGAASGIGLAISQELSEDSMRVVMVDINKVELKKQAKLIDADYYSADLTDAKECKETIEYVIEKYSRIDILINVAGIQHVSSVEDFPEEKWNFIISLMLTAPFLLTKYSIPYMKSNNWGRIINLNSIHGLVASPYKSAYISAKHGLTGLTKATALEVGKYGITVNSINPSYVRTPLVDKQIKSQSLNHKISEERVIEEVMLTKSVVKSLIEPEAIADIVRLLCSDSGKYITGTTLSIDGGWTAS